MSEKKKILVAVDSSEHAEKVTQEALTLAAGLQAEVEILTVYEDLLKDIPQIPQAEKENIRKSHLEELEALLEEKAEKFRAKGISVKTTLRKGRPGQVICSAANENGYFLVLIGSRGLSGISELLLGSVSSKVAHCAKASVMIIK